MIKAAARARVDHVAVIVKEGSMIEENPSTLPWDNGKGALRARPNS